MKFKLFNSIILSYCLAIFGSGYVSLLFFDFCKSTFETLKEKEIIGKENTTNNTVAEPVSESNGLNLSRIHSFKTLTECKIEHFDDDFDCYVYKKQYVAESKDDKLFDNIGTNILIKVIEKLLITGLAVQLFLTVYTICLKKYSIFDKYVFHFSDWAINTPPILGVLANLVSFSLLLSQVGDIQLMFSGYFFQAVITTLIGGVFYIINMALKIIIHPRIEAVT